METFVGSNKGYNHVMIMILYCLYAFWNGKLQIVHLSPYVLHTKITLNSQSSSISLECMQISAELRMYCIDTPMVPESSDAGIFHCLYDYGILMEEHYRLLNQMNSKAVRAASVKHKY